MRARPLLALTPALLRATDRVAMPLSGGVLDEPTRRRPTVRVTPP